MKTHSFDPVLARKIGLKPAIVYETIFHIREEDEYSVLDRGMTWTRLPMSTLKEIFPYMSADTIARCIRKLRNEGLIDVEHYDEHEGRTNWYALT